MNSHSRAVHCVSVVQIMNMYCTQCVWPSIGGHDMLCKVSDSGTTGGSAVVCIRS